MGAVVPRHGFGVMFAFTLIELLVVIAIIAILTGLSGTRFKGTNSPARAVDPIGPLTADHTMVFTTQNYWRMNHGKQGSSTDPANEPAGHNQSFSDGHAEWILEKRFARSSPAARYPRALWVSGWPWDWAWVEP